jgi:hypothetical protein
VGDVIWSPEREVIAVDYSAAELRGYGFLKPEYLPSKLSLNAMKDWVFPYN